MSSSSLLPSKRSHEDVSSAEKSKSQQPTTQKQKELSFKEKKEKLLYGSSFRWYPLPPRKEPMEPKEKKKIKCVVCLKEDDHYTCACKWFNKCTSLDKVGPEAELICICCGDDAYTAHPELPFCSARARLKMFSHPIPDLLARKKNLLASKSLD